MGNLHMSKWKIIRNIDNQNCVKPIDKVEPKFKVGDWVVRGDTIAQILDIQEQYYVGCDINGKDFTSSRFLNDDKIHLWTIQDAKDGDVLHSTGWHNDCIFIFNSLDNWKFDEPNRDTAVATGYCCLSVSADKMEFGIQGPDCVEVNTVKPATKIQRDLLFQKMKEAGYEWDDERKELKKNEQKPAWSEEDETYSDHIITAIKSYYTDDKGKENPWREELLRWFKSLKDRYT